MRLSRRMNTRCGWSFRGVSFFMNNVDSQREWHVSRRNDTEIVHGGAPTRSFSIYDATTRLKRNQIEIVSRELSLNHETED